MFPVPRGRVQTSPMAEGEEKLCRSPSSSQGETVGALLPPHTPTGLGGTASHSNLIFCGKERAPGPRWGGRPRQRRSRGGPPSWPTPTAPGSATAWRCSSVVPVPRVRPRRPAARWSGCLTPQPVGSTSLPAPSWAGASPGRRRRRKVPVILQVRFNNSIDATETFQSAQAEPTSPLRWSKAAAAAALKRIHE